MNQKHFYVYIIANKNNTILYTGVKSKLSERAEQHIEKQNKSSFMAKYNLNKVVHIEEYSDIKEAILREKQIKAGSRKKKILLINTINPGWNDLLK